MISSVQIISIILMAIMSIVLAFILPKYCKLGRIYETSRKLLLVGTILISIHFAIQLYIGSIMETPDRLRTTINLLFGFPITYFVNMSLIFAMKRGNVKKVLWYTIPSLYLLAIMLFCYFMLLSGEANAHKLGNTTMALLYCASLLYVSYVEVRGYIKVNRSIRIHNNTSYKPIVKWTRWSVLSMLAVSLGFPFMTFTKNENTRAAYGILAILTGFIYCFSFIGYGISRAARRKPNENENNDKHKTEDLKKDNKDSLTPQTRKRVEFTFAAFEQNEYFTKHGLKIKDAADLMGISGFTLRHWLANTEYKKYNTWITALRIKKAKALMMQNPKASDENIAKECGFCDRQYFRNIFRKEEGLSPSQWTKQNKKENAIK